eukprot:454594_1
MALFVFIFLLNMIACNYTQTPPELIQSIVSTIFKKNAPNCTMFQYQYGGAIIFDAMYKATQQFAADSENYNTTMILDYNSQVLPILNYYLFNDTSTPGYMITHGQTIPWTSGLEGAIGDHTGLFPITYLDALLYDYEKYSNNDIFNFNGRNKTQWQLIFTTMDYYILQFNKR